MESTVYFLKSIADKNRLLILFLLKDRALCVCDIQKIIPLTQGALSIQLKNLSSCGLLNKQKQGKWAFYMLSKNIKSSHLNILSQLFNDIEENIFIKNAVLKLTMEQNIEKLSK